MPIKVCHHHKNMVHYRTTGAPSPQPHIHTGTPHTGSASPCRDETRLQLNTFPSPALVPHSLDMMQLATKAYSSLRGPSCGYHWFYRHRLFSAANKQPSQLDHA